MECLETNIVDLFHWCLICMVGCLLKNCDWMKFDCFVRDLSKKKFGKLCPEGCIYDYYFCMKKNCWVSWSQCYEMCEIIESCNYGSIVPTPELMRNKMVANMLLKNDYPVMIAGPNGSGKSLHCEEIKKMNNWHEIWMNWSSFTNSCDVYEDIMCGLSKRRKNCYGPSSSNKGLICIDDINHPNLDKYGTRPSSEVMKQLMEYKTMWNMKNKQMMQVEDCNVLATCCTDLRVLNPRLISKFNILCCQ